MRCGNIEDRLQPGQRKIDPEACTLGLQKLRKLVSVVSQRSLIQRPRANGCNAFDVAAFRIERNIQYQMSRDHMLAREVEDNQLHNVWGELVRVVTPEEYRASTGEMLEPAADVVVDR